jgi:hypothetical protein
MQVVGGVCPLSTPPGLEDHSLQVSTFVPLLKVSSGRAKCNSDRIKVMDLAALICVWVRSSYLCVV